MFFILIIYENRWNIFCFVYIVISLIKIYVISVYLVFFFERKEIIKFWLKIFFCKVCNLIVIEKKCLIMSICVYFFVCLMLSVFLVFFVMCYVYLLIEIFFVFVGFFLSIY